MDDQNRDQGQLIDELDRLRRRTAELEAVAAERSQAKETLKRLAAVVRDSNDAIIVQDIDGRITAWNRGAELMYGYSEAEALGMNIDQLSPPDKVSEQKEFTRRLIAGEAVTSFETQRVTKDGSILDVWLTVTKLVEDPADSIISTGRDITIPIGIALIERNITERKRAEEDLRKIEGRFRALVESSLDVTIVLNAQGNVIYLSPNFEKVWGFKAEGVLGQDLFKNIHPDDIPEIGKNFSDIIKNPKTLVRMPIRALYPDGTWHTLDAEARNHLKEPAIGGIVVNFHDVTELKRAQEVLNEKERYFRSLIENSSDGIMVLDRNGKILYESLSCSRLLGYSEGERIGQVVFEPIHPDDIPVVARAFEKVIGGGMERTEVRARHRDGSWRFLETTATSFLDDPAVGGVVVNLRDITERKRAEDSLRQSEEQYSTLVENATDGVSIIQDQVIKFANRRMSEMSGYTVEELTGMSTFDFVPPDFKPKLAERFARRAQGEELPDVFETKMLSKDGTVKDMESSIKLIQYQGSQAVISITRDITERKRAEEALRESEEKNRALIENIRDAIFIIKDAKIKYANEGFAKITGYSVNELIGKGIDELVAPEDLAMVADRYVRRMKGEQVPSEYEFKLVKKDGATRVDVIMDVGVITYEGGPAAMGIGKDITERKRMQDALRESEEKYRLLAENATDVIMLMDMNAKPVYFSPSVARLLGYSVEEALTGSMNDRMAPASIEKAVKHFMAGLHRERRDPGGSAGQTLELEMIHKNGSVVIVEIMVSFIRDENGKPTGMMAILRDLTERKKAEKEIVALSNAFKAARDPIIIFDMQGNVVNANETAHQLFERDDVGSNALEIVAPEDRDRVAAVLQDLISSGQSAAARFNIVTRSGRRVPVEASGSIIRDAEGKSVGIVVVERDLTERRQAESRQKLAAEILGILNEPLVLPDAINRILAAIKRETGFYAVGIRLKKDEDFPYFVQSGFSEDFLLTENTIVVRDSNGGICRDKDGNVRLECTCGLVLSGKTDPSNPLFTPGGSAWTNDSIPLLDIPPEQDPRLHPRNRCIHAGFQSVALMPIRSGNEIIGLLQLNDRRKGCFTPEMIRFFEGIAASIGVALVRKQVEDALRESEERYRMIVENVSDALWIMDMNFNLTYHSGGVRIFGYTAEEMLKRTVDQRMTPESVQTAFKALQEELANEQLPDKDLRRKRVVEVAQYHKNGSIVHTEETVSFLRDKEGMAIGIIGVTRDITERKLAEDALSVSEVRYRRLFESAKDGILILDAETGMVVDVNPFLIEMLGYSHEQFIGKRVWELGPLHDIIPNRDNFLELQRQEYIRYEDLPLETIGGRRVDVEFVSNVYPVDHKKVIQCNIRDITERKRAQKALRESEIKYRDLFEQTLLGTEVVDGETGKILLANHSMARIFGFKSPGDMVGIDAIRDHILPEDMDWVLEQFAQALVNPESHEIATLRARKVDGRIIWVTGSATAFTYEGKTAVLISLIDVTAVKEAEDKLKETEERIKSIVTTSQEWIWAIDPKGNHTFSNPAIENILGYRPDEIIGRDSLSLTHADDAATVRQLLSRCVKLKTGWANLVVRWKHKDGSYRYLESNAVPILDSYGVISGFQGTDRDITDRKKAEETLLRINKAVEGSSDAIGISDAQGHHFYHNRAFTELFEYTAEELEAAGGGPAAFANKHIARKVFDTIMGGGSWFGEVEMVSKSGRKFTVLERADAIKDEKGKVIGLVGVHTDITERKKAEEKLRETRDYMENLIEHANVPMVVWTPDFRITRFNRAFERLTGMKAKSVIGKDLEILFPKGTGERSMSFIRTAMRGARWEVVEIPIANVDGGVRTVLWNISPVYAEDGKTPMAIIAQGQDITERKKAEEALRESEELSRSMLDNAAMGIYLLQNRKFIYVNPTFEKIIGYGSEELMGQEAINYVHPDDRDIVRAKAVENIQEKSVQPYEFRALRKDGRQIWVMERVTPVRYKGRRAVLASFMETTEHKKAEVELERAYEELKTAHERMVQSEKLRAMGEMASGIAHDFNNMLAVILGRTQLVIDDVKDDKVKKGIQIIEQAALDAAKTVKRLQDFARIRMEHPFEPLDVNEVVEGVLKMVESRRVELEQTKGIAIKVEQELAKVGKVSGDAAELREALLNILFNALDAMPTGGKLTVKTSQDEEWVQITIKDTGVGIPDKVKSKVFQPFFTTKASKGSGLGLSVTYGIISRHGGMIKFDSEVGKGTTFYIRLPLGVEEVKKQARKSKAVTVKPASILTVDDEPEVLKALGLTLEYFGHWVKDFTRGADAIKAFKDGKYDIVITDLGMPEMSGWDVARAIKKIKPEVPVLLITGWVIDLDEEKKKLVDGVISKPFSRESIASAISGVFPAKKKRVVKKKTAVKKKSG